MYDKGDHESLKEKFFRLSPEYTLIPYNRIDHNLYSGFVPGEISEDELFGILHHKKKNYSSFIDQNTALLLYTLQDAGKLPHYIISEWDSGTAAELKFMLGKGILELKISNKHEEERFVSGTEALKLIQNKKQFTLPNINKDAILQAITMLPADHMTLASTLYFFNRKPVSRDLSKFLADANSVKQFLTLTTSTPKTKFFYKQWAELQRTEGWIAFQSKKNFQEFETKTDQTYKLYISPDSLERFLKIFFDVTTLLSQSKAFQFKIGNDAFGLQRPDKWVAYFYDKKSLFDAILSLQEKIGDIPAQEVPFSSSSDVKWLNWGKDPKHYTSTSWRWLICSEVAYAILDVAEKEIPEVLSMDTVENIIWPYIQVRLEREGINAGTFEPMD